MSSTPRTVLIVEDEALIAMDIEMQLQDAGLETIVTSTIDEAQRVLASRKVDLAVLDYSLRDGAKTTPVAAALRELRIPFIVCSGSQFNDMAAAFVGAPVATKPFRGDILREAVMSVVEGGSLERGSLS